MIQHDPHATTLMVSQRMSNIAARLLHIQRHAPVALLVEQDLIQSRELPVNAIRNNKIVRVKWSELTDDERRAAQVNLFHTPEYI